MNLTENYFRVPNSIFDLPLSLAELAVLTYLYRCANNRVTAFPSYSTIATKCHIHRITAIHTIKSLEFKELLTISRQFHKPNFYAISVVVQDYYPGSVGIPLRRTTYK